MTQYEIGELDLTAQVGAAQTATNYMSFDSTNGLKIASSSPSSATRRVQITSSNVGIYNDNNNYANVSSNGLTVYQGGNDIATFGGTARIGRTDRLHATFSNDGMRLYEKNETPYADASAAKFTINESVIGNVTDIHSKISSNGFQLLVGEDKLFSIDTAQAMTTHSQFPNGGEIKSLVFDEVFGEGTISSSTGGYIAGNNNVHDSGSNDGWCWISSSMLRAKPQLFLDAADQTYDTEREWVPVEELAVLDFLTYEYTEPEVYGTSNNYRFYFKVSNIDTYYLPIRWKMGIAHYDYNIDVQIGKTNESHAKLDYHSLQLIDKDGGEYLHISDLREGDGCATITETMKLVGTNTYLTSFSVTHPIYSLETTTVIINNNPVSVASIHDNTITLSNSVYVTPEGIPATVTYKTNTNLLKAYTLGTRKENMPIGGYSYALGYNVAPHGYYSFAEGYNTSASEYCHAEGYNTVTIGYYSHAEGHSTSASDGYSHAEGRSTIAKSNSHAEGYSTKANGNVSHAEGFNTKANGSYSHAEGYNTKANGSYSHAEGFNTFANNYSHAEGYNTQANGGYSHAEGYNTFADGSCSHAQNYYTKASSSYQTAIGKYNVEDTNNTYAVIVGNGTANNARSNALTVNWNGAIEQGTGTKASSSNQVTIGKYNVEDTNDTYAFIIGNGTADNARHDALGIDWNGTIISKTDISPSWISGCKGEGASLYTKKQTLNTAQANPAVAIQTYGGGGWSITNYNNENLYFTYGTKANIDSNTNTVSQVYLQAGSSGKILVGSVSGTYNPGLLAKDGTATSTTARSSGATYTVNVSIAAQSGYFPMAVVAVKCSNANQTSRGFDMDGLSTGGAVTVYTYWRAEAAISSGTSVTYTVQVIYLKSTGNTLTAS